MSGTDRNRDECVAPGGHCFEREDIELTTLPPQYPEKCKHCGETRVAVPLEPYAYRYGGPLTDEEAADLEQRLREELAKPHTYKVLSPASDGPTVSLRTITAPNGMFVVIDDEYKDKLVDYYGQKLAVVPASVVDDTAKQALTLKPGETLIIRVSDMTPNQVQQYQEHLEAMLEYRGLDLRVLIVYGDELAIQESVQ